MILLFPVLLASVMTRKTYDVFGQLRRGVALCVTAVSAYLVTTPATIFDPFQFVEQLQWISEHYKTAIGPIHRKRFSSLVARAGLPFRRLLLALPGDLRAGAPVGTCGGRVLVARRSARRRCADRFPLAFLCFFCFRYKAMLAGTTGYDPVSGRPVRADVRRAVRAGSARLDPRNGGGAAGRRRPPMRSG